MSLLVAAIVLASAKTPVTTLYPATTTMYGGGLQSGVLTDVYALGGAAMRFNRCLAPPTMYLAQVSCAGFGANYTGTPTSMSVTWTEKMSNPGAFQTRLQLYNYSTTSWDSYPAGPIITVFTTKTVVALVPTDYVDSNGDMLARVDTFQVGPSAVACPSNQIDEFYWTLSP